MTGPEPMRSGACNVSFEGAAGGLKLSGAILLYKSSSRIGQGGAEAFASMHAVDHAGGQPVIEAGSPLTRAHLRQWAQALGRNAPPEILPDNVLVAHSDMLVWWLPEQTRPGYFALSNPPKGLKALGQRTTVTVPYPAHVLIATRSGLAVYALPENKRPSADTVLLHSPVLNVFLDGKLCWGNIAKPKALTVAAMAEYERALFDSWSTHPNAGQDHSITGKGGLIRLWDDLAARWATRFPTRRLKPFHPAQRRPENAAPITLGQIIAKASS